MCIKCSTLMMITQAVKTCQKLIICDETYFVHVHLLVLLSFNIPLILRCGTCFVTVLLSLHYLTCFISVMP